MKTKLILSLILVLLLSSLTNNKQTGSCNQKQLAGLYTYLASPTTFIYRYEDKMMEKLGDIGVNIEYDVKWNSKTSCNHKLIVTKVTTTSRTPEEIKPYLLKVGDVLQITVLEVNDKYMSYQTQWKDKTVSEIMHRISEEQLLGK